MSFVTTGDTADYNLDVNAEPFRTLTCFLKGGLLLQLFWKVPNSMSWCHCSHFSFYFILSGESQYTLVDVGVLSLIHYSTNPPSTLTFLLTSLKFLMGNMVWVTLNCFFNLALGIYDLGFFFLGWAFKVYSVKMISLTGASSSMSNFRGKICKSWDQHLIWALFTMSAVKKH